jgi:hypothetical protein
MADFSQAELDALLKAYASGTTRVEYDGRVVVYDGRAELEARIAYVRGSLNADAGIKRPRVGFAGFNRGY